MRSRTWCIVLTAAVSMLAACGGSPAAPSTNAVATIRVESEVFRVRLSTAAQVAAAQAAMVGGAARIPNGRIASGTDVNAGYSWHLEDVEFVQAAIELCDGRPSMVEQQGTSFGGGRYCPWGAQVVAIQ
jgi:hypothetical protein